jgi:hypothetical protein
MFAEINIITRRPPVRPPNGTRPGSVPHPSRGGSTGYSQDLRNQVITLWMNGDDLMDPWIKQLRFQRKFPCYQTCRRWISQYIDDGNTCRKMSTGNRFSEREVHGQDLFNLALYRTVRPKAYIDEVCAYVHNRNPNNPPYS